MIKPKTTFHSKQLGQCPSKKNQGRKVLVIDATGLEDKLDTTELSPIFFDSKYLVKLHSIRFSE
jgi:hypothetical protein